jgi:hypothetical protein
MSEKTAKQNRDKLNRKLKEENIKLHNTIESQKNLNKILQDQIVAWDKNKNEKSKV